MVADAVLSRFIEKTPLTVMARACIEHALDDDALNALFVNHAEWQYERSLLFSTVVDLMSLVVCRVERSIPTAYKSLGDRVGVSLSSFYDKLDGIEPRVSAALVEHSASRLESVVHEMGGQLPPLVDGYRTRIIDGNHFAATQRRLAVLRGSKAGPLPGQALVVLDPSLMLATHMIPCEDAHAQERSLFGEVLGLVAPKDLWVADRNFCTFDFLSGLAERDAAFVIRHHAGMPPVSSTKTHDRGRCSTGTVSEEDVTFASGTGTSRVEFTCRRIVVTLDKPTQNGDTQIAVLSNLPKSAASAATVADIYVERWTIEGVFLTMTQILDGEPPSLCYPKAALFAFAVALTSYNIASTMRAALRARHGHEKVETELSWYYMTNEVRVNHGGMDVAVEENVLGRYRLMSAAALAAALVDYAGRVRIDKFKKTGRGPKNPAKRTKYINETHISTGRILARAGHRT